VSEFDARTLQAVELLAIEAAVAIERADFLARLSGLAETESSPATPTGADG
jgi:hypothetical protein